MAVSMISGMPAASSIFAMYASVSAFFMLVQTMVNGLVPRHMQQYLLDLLRRYFAPKATNSTAVVMIEEQAGMSVNEMYTAAETYLSSQRRPEIQRLKISKGWKDPGLTVRFADFDKIVDSHHDIKLEWRFVEEQMRENETAGQISEKKHFELSFDIKFRDEVLDSYLPSIIERARTIKATRKKVVKLHTLSSMGMGSNSMFDSINLEHPSTFETLAMEPEMKKMIVDDLDRFVRRKDFYRRVGKAWKRGYLLYGPPGTGKSSLIAAMANYLKFDIYDLELTNVHCDSVLRQLLLRTANRSIIVIEDIDCTVELPSRMPGGAYYPRRDQRFSLSRLLNFIDGLWSSCGDERIIIFTTNNKDKLEPALLRPGRMDVHIHMSYLTAEGFKTLASTYLDVPGHHPRLLEIGDLIKVKNITPAEIAEELMKCQDDVDSCLDGIVHFLESKTNNNNNNDNSEVGNVRVDDINVKQVVDDDDDDDDDEDRNHDDGYDDDDRDDQLFHGYHHGDDDDDDDEQLFHDYQSET